MLGHVQQLLVIAHEQLRQRVSQQLRQYKHSNRKARQHNAALPQEALQLIVIFGAVVIAHHRGAADGETDKHGAENHADIHQHAIGRNAVLSRVAQQLHILQHTHQRHGDIAHQLGGAVRTGLAQLVPEDARAGEL